MQALPTASEIPAPPSFEAHQKAPEAPSSSFESVDFLTSYRAQDNLLYRYLYFYILHIPTFTRKEKYHQDPRR